MKKLLYYLRLAQWYSDAAKGNIYFKESKKHIDNFQRLSSNTLYSYKTDYLLKAAKRAYKIGQRAYYDFENSCIYFELDNGQVSFHVYDMEDEISKYCICGSHKWNGLFNSRSVLDSYFLMPTI